MLTSSLNIGGTSFFELRGNSADAIAALAEVSAFIDTARVCLDSVLINREKLVWRYFAEVARKFFSLRMKLGPRARSSV